ncbi:putative NADPH-dependent methylglyoxal reductase GRP2 [Spathaspora sp. JA1]|nr:putative NADPH-dependent methylglyoxal reductase GRP2 [Spathaspora sp. JA1]
MTATTVFVSGANGFIAQHIVKQLLAKGYTVIGSVRSEAKGKELAKLVQNDQFSYEIVASLTEEGAFDEVLKKHPEVTVFLHTASPFSFSVEDVERDLLNPAKDGTINALKAIKQYGPQIKKVVITASAVAIFGFGPHFEPSKVYTEKDWNPVTYEESLSNSVFGYFGSKKFAELAANEFVDKEHVNFDISFINPPYVFGPQAYAIEDKSNLNLSNEVINRVVKLNKDEPIPAEANLFVDVRDVAHAHLVAFENDKANGERLMIISHEKYTLDLIANIIHEKFPQTTIPKGDNSRTEELLQGVHKFDDSRTRKILGFEYKSLEETVYDTVAQIYNA